MKIEINIFERGCKKRHHRRGPVVGRFAGIYHVNSKGEFIVANQTVPPSQVSTAPLVFVQDGASVKGPVGDVVSSDPSVTPTLSSDGQAVNFTSPASGTFNLKWHIADASVAPFDVDVAVGVAPPPPPGPIIGSFGPIVAGTTP